MRSKFLALAALVALAQAALAGDFLFINTPYLRATKQVIAEANKQSVIFAAGPEREKYAAISGALGQKIDAVQRKRLQKKITADVVTDTEEKAFADALNAFNDALNAMEEKSGRPLKELLPSYEEWNKLETDIVKQGVEGRLAAYETRFGADSEPINLVELLISEKVLPGNEAGPSAWEPILRFSAVQVSSRGDALTSGMELGANYYFLSGTPPKPLGLMGLSNHIGVAATLQYLEDPGVFNFRGRPAFGAMVHLDRKEVGVVWDNKEDKFRITIGYSFQFVPFVF